MLCACAGCVYHEVRCTCCTVAGRVSGRYTLKDGPMAQLGTFLLSPKVRFKGAVLHNSTESVILSHSLQMCHRIGENLDYLKHIWGIFEHIWSIFEAYLEHIWAYSSIFEHFLRFRWRLDGFFWVIVNNDHSANSGNYWQFLRKAHLNGPESQNMTVLRLHLCHYLGTFWPLLSLSEVSIVPSDHFWRCLSRDFLNSLKWPRWGNGPELGLIWELAKSWQKAWV